MSPNPARDRFLDRVRRAAAAGNQAGDAAALEPRGHVGYQGAGADPAARFCAELQAAGGHAHRVAGRAAAADKVVELIQSKSARRVLLGGGDLLTSLGLPGRLRDLGIEATSVTDLPPGAGRDPFFAADVGVTGADYLVAETGTLALCSGPDGPRSLSLLPPVHVAVAEVAQLVPDLFDLFALFAEGASLPSCLTLITGPSKTGDIELRLVTGVHGPGEVHVVLIDAA